MKKCLTLSSMVLLIGMSSVSLADTPVGRYITVKDGPTHAQTDLLSQSIQMRFPPTVQTVGEALGYVLRFSGYSLVPEKQQSAELKNTLLKPLPLVDREFGPMSLKEALVTLAGPAFTLVSDSLQRTVDFKLKTAYMHSMKRTTHKIKHFTLYQGTQS